MRPHTDRDADALDQPNLHKRVVGGIMRLKRRGPRGAEKLPPVVGVLIEVGQGSMAVVQSFIDDPEFDRDVEHDLLNRLVKIRGDGLPTRLYEVRAAARTRVTVAETTDGNLAWLQIDGGDCHDAWYNLALSQAEWRLGRGPIHGDDNQIANDVSVSNTELFVSRKAAVLRRVGSGLVVESLDQGDYLAGLKDGQRLRPTHARSATVKVRPGDAIEFSDGKSKKIMVRVHSRLPAAPGGTPARR